MVNNFESFWSIMIFLVNKGAKIWSESIVLDDRIYYVNSQSDMIDLYNIKLVDDVRELVRRGTWKVDDDSLNEAIIASLERDANQSYLTEYDIISAVGANASDPISIANRAMSLRMGFNVSLTFH
jgi:hypothetical protein